MSQSQQILRYLRKGRSLTALQALHKFGCLRLAARIYSIERRYCVRNKSNPNEIHREWVRVGRKHVVQYSLKERTP